MVKKGRVFSGARPTGRQHLGNYLGAIKNYVALQADYDCVYCIVDLHALTTLTDTAHLKEWTYEMVLDWLAAGIDPDRGTLVFVQSHVPEHSELTWLLNAVTPVGELEIPELYPAVLRLRDIVPVDYELPGCPPQAR